ncbi:FecR domain-containing protein [Marinomonas polaris]|uniref:FecR domain-containing protein n=1 Tax=Marinomonas polaris TaxID=293552 RepID=UPI003515E2F6
MASSQPSNYVHLEAAAEWFAVLADKPVAEADQLAWQQWLNEDEAHRQAWLQVESVGAMFSSFQDNGSQQSARYVLDTTSSMNSRSMSSSSMNRRQLMKGVLGVTGVAALGWIGWSETPLPRIASAWMANFHTQVGQVSAYDLEDGTKVWLNTNSAMNRSYGRDYRGLSLVTGEILVQTKASSDSRAFSVSCAHGVVSSGTATSRFCVRQLSDKQTVLAVYEGAVSLAPFGSQLSRALHAGQEVVFNAQSIADTRPASLLYESWRNGLLIVEDMPLANFMAEIGRYHYGHINLDSSVADLRVVGTFPTHDLDLVLSMLSKSFPIRVKHPLPWWVSVSAA